MTNTVKTYIIQHNWTYSATPMAWITNGNVSLMAVLNSTISACVPCLYIFPQTYATILTSAALLSLPLRGWALWLLASVPIKEKMDLFGINLMISDLLLTFASLLTMSDVFLFHQFFQYIWSFLLSFMNFGRPLLQSFISVERYLAVRHPIVFLRYRALHYRLATLASAWVSVLTVCSLGVALCVSQRNYISLFLQLQCSVLLILFLISSFCCVVLLGGLIRSPPGDGKGRGENGRRGRQDRIDRLSHHIKKKSFILVIMIQMYGLASYLPPAALIFSNHVWEQEQFCTVYMFNLCILLLTSVVFSLHHLHNMGKLSWIK